MGNKLIHQFDLIARWQSLIQPIVAPNDVDHRQQAQLLAGISLAVLVVSVIGVMLTLPHYNREQQLYLLPVYLGILSFYIPYYQSRRGKTRTAIKTLSFIAIFLITGAMFGLGGLLGRDVSYYYIVFLAFISMFSSWRATLASMFTVIGLLLLYQWVNPQLSWIEMIRGPVAFNILSTSFIVVYISFWRWREQQKRRLLAISEQQRIKLMEKRHQHQMLTQMIEALTHDFGNRLSVIEINRHIVHRKLEKLGVVEPTLFIHLEKMNKSTQQIKSQIKNLRLIIELNELTPVIMDITNTLQIVLLQMQPLAAYHQVDLDISVLPVPINAFCNPKSLKLAISYVVENAIIYTPPGGQVVSHAGFEDGYAVITITDTGNGIATEHLSHVFELFYKVDEARTITHSGLGLGLPIARIIMQNYSGSIDLHSMVGEGTTVKLRLPAPQSRP